MVSFPPFRVDVAEERLWKGSKLLAVRRKPFAILRYLVANPRRLVTHEELLKEVWNGVVVSESAVRTHLHELRQLLGEGVIETVIGRGYRFIAPLHDDVVAAAPAASAAPPAPVLVGRAGELEVLRAALARVRTGHRQLCFVTGEPGIGKTTLVDAFVDELDGSDVIAVRGHCIEQHGSPEPYLAVIELITSLRHSEHGDRVLAALVRHAPTFLAQLTPIIPDAQLDEVLRRARGGTEAKMVRELIEALEAICAQHALVVVLEDLQWSDVATIDLLAVLGQRRERAQLMVIATSRRSEAQTVTHPLNRVMRTLVARAGAIAVPIERIAPGEIEHFIAARFTPHAFPHGFVEVVDRITAGTPLFLASLLDDLVGRGMVEQRDGRWQLTVSIAEVAAHRADSVKQLIDLQLDRLAPSEQRVLEAASAIGAEFSTALVAAALEIPVEQSDEICDGLARRGLFLRHAGIEDWPDGAQHSRYGVTHGLVQEVCIARGAPTRLQRWHRLIAERLEAAYGDRAAEVATVLAAHYDQGQVVARALHFYLLAANRMAHRFASVDALALYQHALALLNRMPENTERDEIELQTLGGMASSVLRNRFDRGESLAQFERTIVLARRLGDHPRLCAAMVSLSVRLSTLASYRRAIAINDELADVIGASSAPSLVASANAARALPLFWQGRLAESIALLEPLTRPDATVEEDTYIGILDPTARKTVLMSYLGASYWLAGSPDRGLRELERAVADAMAHSDPYTVGLTSINLARFRLLRLDPPAEIRAIAERVIANSDATVWHLQASMLVDWARSREQPLPRGDLDRMLRDFRERAAAFPMGTTYLAIAMIEALRRSGCAGEASALVDEMLRFAHHAGELLFVPELVRLRGEIVEATDPVTAAAAYREAIALAQAAGARSLELRAAVALATLHASTDERSSALACVAAAVSHITDGFATPDLARAHELLATRSG